MANAEPPKQKWNLRLVLQAGVIFDVVTEMTPEEIDAEINEAGTNGREAKILGLNEKRWPVVAHVLPSMLMTRIISPSEVYLAARPSLSING